MSEFKVGDKVTILWRDKPAWADTIVEIRERPGPRKGEIVLSNGSDFYRDGSQPAPLGYSSREFRVELCTDVKP